MAADRRLFEFARRMRREPTPAEEAVWRFLRNRRLAGYKFRRQHPIGLYVADFYTAAAALVVELDGDSHVTQEGIEHDRIRHACLQALGLRVIRFWNFEVKEDTDALQEFIGQVCAERAGLRRLRLPRTSERRGTENSPDQLPS